MPSTLKLVGLGALTASLAFTAAACAPSDSADVASSSSASTETSASEPVDGGTIVYGLDRDIASLDPASGAISSQTVQSVANSIFDALMQYDEAGELVPFLAESFEAADETSSEWVLTLREGVTFSDGSVLDAAAVIAHVQRLGTEETSASRATVATIANMEEVSATEVRFTLVAPNASFPQYFTRDLGQIASTTATDEFGFPLGTGPYVTTEYSAGTGITMTKREDYWGEAAHADTVEFQILPDADSRYQSLVSGAVDAIWSEVPSQFTGAEADGLATATGNSATSFGLFNSYAAPFDSVEARQAVVLAIDPQALLAVANDGTGAVATSVLQTTSGYDITDPQPAYDPEAAQAIVDEIGGFEFSYLTDGRAEAAARAAAMQQMLAEVGITMTIQSSDMATWGAALYSGEYQMLDFTTSLFGNIDTNLSMLVGTGGLANFMGYSNEDVDAMLAELAGETDHDARGVLLNSVAAQVWDEAPLVMYTENLAGVIYNPETLQGVEDFENRPQVSVQTRLMWHAEG
ncbi:ABC transporter substrate-binding protein [Demequina mangrovi]|uniref:ABC-type transport system, substrate-binding protein n=1 Tax=Demequina mangrovi TaxID=1043493 RepID=A0A1H7B226_9MICO|nr:ABC transporter substrate-binding protein [Demequina mangrovi]SEJ71216.1 ABC-type transport system, substrate-binding protein [Demequina mangrovi]